MVQVENGMDEEQEDEAVFEQEKGDSERGSKEEEDSVHELDPDDYEDLQEPINNGEDPRFRDLVMGLLEPLSKGHGASSSRGRSRPARDARRDLIARFIARWRKDVGPNIYPAFRLVMPDRDKDRPMYGVKEAVLSRILIKVLRLSPNSEDAQALKNWKLPGQSRYTGDFAGRAYDVLEKRPLTTEWSSFTLADVNERLDQLSRVSKEENQRPIIVEMYEKMCPLELKWLIRILLRQMKIGATERTFLDIWHPDAYRLFNVCSSLRRVCWELHDPSHRLEDQDKDVSNFSCFLPQLASFKKKGIPEIVEKMSGRMFWIEDKLDGERIQLHKKGDMYRYFSRKAKDYTYLYGETPSDETGALTKYIHGSFDTAARELILDGEMIVWDPVQEAIVPFGTLKAAALSEKETPLNDSSHRVVYTVFDILLLNGHSLVSYPLSERYKALNRVVKPVPNRFQILGHEEAGTSQAVDERLRKVVEEGSEGLVIKDPSATYCINERNDTWIKVKPEYMNEFGENLDVLIIGALYGGGRRGGNLSSFVCGLRVDADENSPVRYHSFCRIGGGFTADDYSRIRHATEGHWREWDPRAVAEFYDYAGNSQRSFMKPDKWIEPSKSIVIQIKAAQAVPSDQFKTKITLRFPRFQRVREDKDYMTALSYDEFHNLRLEAETEIEKKELTAQSKRRPAKRIKRSMSITGERSGSDAGQSHDDEFPADSEIFRNRAFVVLTGAPALHHTRRQLESLLEHHGGQCIQSTTGRDDVIVVAQQMTASVQVVIKSQDLTIVKPRWIMSCVESQEFLPYGTDDLIKASIADEKASLTNLDQYGDSYVANITSDDLRTRLDAMPVPERSASSSEGVPDFDGLSSESGPWSLRLCVVFLSGSKQVFESDLSAYKLKALGATIAEDIHDPRLSHIVVSSDDRTKLSKLRSTISLRSKIPHIVHGQWVHDCWKNRIHIDEDRYHA